MSSLGTQHTAHSEHKRVMDMVAKSRSVVMKGSILAIKAQDCFAAGKSIIAHQKPVSCYRGKLFKLPSLLDVGPSRNGDPLTTNFSAPRQF